LQQVDGLQTSEYLHDIARRNIEDEISTAEGQQLIASYYEQLNSRSTAEQRDAEGNKAFARYRKVELELKKSLTDMLD